MSDNITDEAKEQLRLLAETHNTDLSDVKETYQEALEEQREKGVSNPQKRALRTTSIRVKGGGMSPSTETLRGVFLGASDPINTSRSTMEDALRYVNKQGVEKAEKAGLVMHPDDYGGVDDIEGSGLAKLTLPDDDDRLILETNSNAPNAGEPIPRYDWIRYVYAFVQRESAETNEQYLVTGIMNGEPTEDGAPDIPPLHEPVKFQAGWMGERNRGNGYSISIDEDNFDPTVVDGVDIDTYGLIENDDIETIDLSDVNANNFEQNDVVVTRGAVTYMELSPDEDQSRRLTVVDPDDFTSDLQRTVWLPDHVDVNFGEESDIFIIGQVSPSNNDDYSDSLSAVGIVPHPDFSVNTEDIESFAEDDEDGAEAEASIDEPEDTTEDEPDEGDIFDDMEYDELQDRAKEAGIKANQSKEELQEALREAEATPEASTDGGKGQAEPEDEGDDWDWD